MQRAEWASMAIGEGEFQLYAALMHALQATMCVPILSTNVSQNTAKQQAGTV